MNKDQQCLLNSISEASFPLVPRSGGILQRLSVPLLCSFPKRCCLSTGVGPASVMVGNLVAGKRIAQASGRDLGQIEDNDLVKKVNQCL